MGIVKEYRYWALCNICKKILGKYGSREYQKLDDIKVEILKDGWQIKGSETICPECKEV